jgi:hypothetical protein
MGPWIRSANFRLSILWFSSGFLIGRLLPYPSGTNFEEVTVVESLGRREHTTEVVDHFTILVSNGTVRMVAPLKRTFILGDHPLPGGGLALEV